jgi:arylsulfatase A-like enzyme
VHGPYLPYDFYFQKRALSYLELLGKELPGSILDYYSSSGTIFKKFCKKYIDSSVNLYEQGIKYTDEKIGELFDFLKKENIYQNSVIFLTADHGSEFLEHGGAEHHMGKLYNELLHVPLLIRIPGERKAETTNKKVSLIDLAPTMCDLAAVEKDLSFKGENLFGSKKDLIFHQSGIAKREDIWNIEVEKLSRCKVACQSMDWKYILNYKSRKEELYNLRNDPKEQKDISGQEPEVLAEMRKAVRDFEKNNPPLSMANEV